jgi:alpha-D-ribose 1-methylphosphonate 5-triphosphate synthase subunit PhnI
LRAYRTTLPRFGYSEPLDTASMAIRRRISATYKDLPGGQVLGPTFDYTHRLLDFKLTAEGQTLPAAERPATPQEVPRVVDILNDEGLIQAEPAEVPGAPIGDLTRDPLLFPAGRDLRLQNLARGDEGFLLALGSSTQRGFGSSHPFVGEIRVGAVSMEITPEELGFPIDIGEIEVTECQLVNQFQGSKTEPPQFSRGYGLAFGHSERKAMAMALVDRALRAEEMGEETTAPAQDQEFVLYHSDNIQATGFVEHLKLPHYVDFQGELEGIRRMRAAAGSNEDADQEAAP